MKGNRIIKVLLIAVLSATTLFGQNKEASPKISFRTYPSNYGLEVEVSFS